MELLQGQPKHQVHQCVGRNVAEPHVRKLVAPPPPDFSSEVLAVVGEQETRALRPNRFQAPHGLRKGRTAAAGVSQREPKPQHNAQEGLSDDEVRARCVEGPDLAEVPVEQHSGHFHRPRSPKFLWQANNDAPIAGDLRDPQAPTLEPLYPFVPSEPGLPQNLSRECLVAVQDDCVADVECLAVLAVVGGKHLVLACLSRMEAAAQLVGGHGTELVEGSSTGAELGLQPAECTYVHDLQCALLDCRSAFNFGGCHREPSR
mmetsp:Transcript_49600/g.144173  ORF Transcript_49600/g.144173 Transcript_49600/m.144173 type:complete len:260 (+) Transcript_49600:701-1480(+)